MTLTIFSACALSFVGCTGAEVDSGEKDAKPEVDTGAADSSLVRDSELTAEEILALLPPCVRGVSDGSIDLDGHCASGGCLGMTLGELDGALGAHEVTAGIVSWDLGIVAEFDVAEEDLSDDVVSVALYVVSYYVGGTDEGLGPGAGMSCFVEDLGAPEVLTALDVGGGLKVVQMEWLEWQLFVTDWDIYTGTEAIADEVGFVEYSF